MVVNLCVSYSRNNTGLDGEGGGDFENRHLRKYFSPRRDLSNERLVMKRSFKL
jgi:hypothetical protein